MNTSNNFANDSAVSQTSVPAENHAQTLSESEVIQLYASYGTSTRPAEGHTGKFFLTDKEGYILPGQEGFH